MDYLLSFIGNFDFSNPFLVVWFILAHGGWILIAYVVMRGLWALWMNEIQGSYAETLSYVVLAINVPKLTEQTPKAVENIFTHLTGLYTGSGEFIDKYWKGKFQENFAVEIVSDGGFIQYYVYVPVKYRNVIEAAIFAQYPDSEIVEATDYLDGLPQTWPDENFDMWGAELTLTKSDVYPIKTYQAFTDQLSDSLKDPLASLLEFLGTLQPGERAFIQIPLLPTNDDWTKRSEEAVKKMIGVKVAPKSPGGIAKLLIGLYNEVVVIISAIFPSVAESSLSPAKSDPNAPASLIQHLSPGERMIVEQVQIKASKPGFLSKIRIVYLAPKEIMSKHKATSGVIGAFKQFSVLGMNGFTVNKLTKVGGGFFRPEAKIAERQRSLWGAYKGRSSWGGGKPYILNVEELATIWHFPMIETKAPLISKAESKRAEPPYRLPVREAIPYAPDEEGNIPEGKKGPVETPDNIPFI